MKKLIAFMISAAMLVSVCAFAAPSEDELIRAVNSAASWKNSNASPYYNQGTEASDLYVFAMKRLGLDCDYRRYSNNLNSVLDSYGNNRSASVYARTILALESCGEDASNYNNRDFVAEGTYSKNNIDSAEDWSWALIALDSRDYTVPDGAVNTRETIIKNIMAEQDTDGCIGNGAQSTALALIALADYTYEETVYSYINNITGEEKNTTAWEIAEPALDFLSREQSDWGDYYDLKTTALVLIALDYMDVNAESDERFIKAEKTVVDGLMEYAVGDGSFSSDMKESDSTATTYAICALTSHLRQIQGKAKLFDMLSNDSVDGVKNNQNSGSGSTGLPGDSIGSGSIGSGGLGPGWLNPGLEPIPTLPPFPSDSTGSGNSSSSSGSSGSGNSTSTAKPGISSGSIAKPTLRPIAPQSPSSGASAPNVQSTKRPAPTTTMSPIGTPMPKKTFAPVKKALVGPVKMPGPLQITPEPAEAQTEELDSPNSRDVSRKLPLGIAMLALAALITAAGVTYVIRTGIEVPLPKKDAYRAKVHRRTEIHGAYKKRGKYKEREKYKGSHRK